MKIPPYPPLAKGGWGDFHASLWQQAMGVINKKLAQKLELIDFTYAADGKDMTLSALGPQLVDFTRVLGLSRYFREHVHIDKGKSPYSPDNGIQVYLRQFALSSYPYSYPYSLTLIRLLLIMLRHSHGATECA